MSASKFMPRRGARPHVSAIGFSVACGLMFLGACLPAAFLSPTSGLLILELQATDSSHATHGSPLNMITYQETNRAHVAPTGNESLDAVSSIPFDLDVSHANRLSFQASGNIPNEGVQEVRVNGILVAIYHGTLIDIQLDLAMFHTTLVHGPNVVSLSITSSITGEWYANVDATLTIERTTMTRLVLDDGATVLQVNEITKIVSSSLPVVARTLPWLEEIQPTGDILILQPGAFKITAG